MPFGMLQQKGMCYCAGSSILIALRNIAKKLVDNKIFNQIKTLQKIRNREEKINKTIKSLKEYKKKLLKENITIKEILGLEGIAAKMYFQSLFKDYRWKARLPRTKIDITNCLLDIGYTLLFPFYGGSDKSLWL